MIKKFLLLTIIALNLFAQNSNKLNKTIFGYLPWWEYTQGSANYIQYNLITHLAVFSFEADSLGNLKDPLNWPWNDVLTNAEKNNVKLILSITNFSPEQIHKLFTDNNSKTNLFKNIESRFKNYNFAGINIDFENLNDEDKNINLINFLSDLKKYLNQIKPNMELSFAAPAIKIGNWNFETMVQICDYLFIMCYDYYGSWNDFTAPSSPLTGTFFNITKSFEVDYSNIVKAQPEKLILGVPYYGNYWKTKEKNPYTKVDTSKANKEWMGYLTYKQIVKYYFNYEKLWDTISQTPWIRWFDTKWNQIWYDDEKSLGLKYDFAIQKKLKGIGIWALGYDGDRSELWNLIEKKFSNPLMVENDHLSFSFTLHQNYPNPFNAETIIRYSLKQNLNVKLELINLLGEKIVLFDEFKYQGEYSFILNADKFGLSSGVYFLKISTGQKTQTIKMILLR
ncbi:MAG: glycosyl hydrolase family 18 protein [Stygiobacter sp.]|jgi:spore germination protein YaaH